MVQQAIQVLLTTVWVLFASPIAAAITPQGWYFLAAGLAGLQFLVALVLLPETKYDRDLSAYQEAVSNDSSTEVIDVDTDAPVKPKVTLCKEKPALDYVNFEPRTWRSDMRLWVGNPEWHKAIEVLKVTKQNSCPHFCSSIMAHHLSSKPWNYFSFRTSYGHCV